MSSGKSRFAIVGVGVIAPFHARAAAVATYKNGAMVYENKKGGVES